MVRFGWGCKCGTKGNYNSRITCRTCGVKQPKVAQSSQKDSPPDRQVQPRRRDKDQQRRRDQPASSDTDMETVDLTEAEPDEKQQAAKLRTEIAALRNIDGTDELLADKQAMLQ